MTVQEYNELGTKLERLLLLRYSPIAFKLLREGDPIPENSWRPFADRGQHMAMCQAYAAVRRDRQAITMLKEDHWCVWPLVSFGICPLKEGDAEKYGDKFFVDDRQKSIEYFKNEYPRLKEEGIIGFTIAPLRSCQFEPDLVTVYCRPGQIRSLQMAAKFHSGKMLELKLDPVDSCVHSSIPVLNGQDFNITFPDPGEYERALTDEDEVMFTMRGEKVSEIVEVLQFLANVNFGYQEMSMSMWYDFPRPVFYNEMFEGWGLATGDVWTKS
ncbi:MAG: DUF169 domain-containing protein [Lachnospiraceae bacterium]|nr:DUF169 domain-containing protein [Lachnospiraceae bacterium]MBQ1400234.1 DUF169 domain-containing protein [Lachnospiraceae bacterium]MBQ4308114.1 DUF169 domain-containing protein [Lachnospiraceae bacterium]MBQ9463736.1 DUF169 domain-containing protein [Lachnospiraceae bacterium]MBR0107398.1 DUF169 domain-containing protein [Lachnospiraceae bacterium]